MPASQASSSRACSSPSKAPPAAPSGMRSPTKIRTPTKLARPRETHWASRAMDAKKRLLGAGDGPSESALPAPKRVKRTHYQPQQEKEDQIPSGEVSGAEDAVEASQEATEGEGYAEGLQRRVQVAQCLEQELLRDNARMRLKALRLREEVDFHYGILARIELVTAQQRREGGQEVTRLAEQLQSIISASKPAEGAVAAVSELGIVFGEKQ
jgi:hypothetical protein